MYEFSLGNHANTAEAALVIDLKPHKRISAKIYVDWTDGIKPRFTRANPIILMVTAVAGVNLVLDLVDAVHPSALECGLRSARLIVLIF